MIFGLNVNCEVGNALAIVPRLDVDGCSCIPDAAYLGEGDKLIVSFLAVRFVLNDLMVAGDFFFFDLRTGCSIYDVFTD